MLDLLWAAVMCLISDAALGLIGISWYGASLPLKDRGELMHSILYVFVPVCVLGGVSVFVSVVFISRQAEWSLRGRSIWIILLLILHVLILPLFWIVWLCSRHRLTPCERRWAEIGVPAPRD